MLEHGGRLRVAAARYGIPLANWIDLSTGISPYVYPVPPIEPEIWQRLPEDEDGLDTIACRYYGAQTALALPGSQAAIQNLPRLRPPGTVAVLNPSYEEYAAAWLTAGHQVRRCSAEELPAIVREVDVVMIGNPNNPTGECFSCGQLREMARQLDARNGWLVVDEAFADAEPDPPSLAGIAGSDTAGNVIVLRSLGKFFGLAGARVGFAIAASPILDLLAELIGPWALSHPARLAARSALADAEWQTAQRERLQRDGVRLHTLLADAGMGQSTGTALFRYLLCDEATALQEFFAGHGILVRHFSQPSAVRFGLPATPQQWQALAATLNDWKNR
ncbi:MAG: threonine-phosphate decarboxylase CobD [Sulfuritalea sp.]|nr:threonine-phosphate decarboxylase CobD [Sulfuritalea sp.]